MPFLSYIVFPLGIILAHSLIVPLVFFPEIFPIFALEQRFGLADKTDIALLIAPLTSASVVSITKFAADNRHRKLSELPKIQNPLFPAVCTIILLCFFGTIFAFLVQFQSVNGGDISVLKGMIGVAEVFFGATYAIIVETLFKGDKQVNNNHSPDDLD